MKKSIFSLALGCALALTALPSCENQMEGNLLPPPPTVESNDSLVAVNFAPTVPLKERTRAQSVGAWSWRDFFYEGNDFCSISYAIYETDGTLVKQNTLYRLSEEGFNFSEPLRRNHDYKVAVWVTNTSTMVDDEGETVGQPGTEIIVLDAEKKEIRYTDEVLNDERFVFNGTGERFCKSLVNCFNSSVYPAVGYLYFGDINVPDGLGAAITRPITLTRPFCTVGVISDEFDSIDFSWLTVKLLDNTCYRFIYSAAGAPSREGGESWAKLPIAYNFWNDQISEYRNSETGVIPNCGYGGYLYVNNSVNSTFSYSGREVYIIGSFSFLAQKNATDDENLYLNILSKEELDGSSPIYNDIHTKLNIGPNKMLQNNLILISNKPGTAFFTNTNNFQPSVNVDFVGSNDVVGTK